MTEIKNGYDKNGIKKPNLAKNIGESIIPGFIEVGKFGYDTVKNVGTDLVTDIFDVADMAGNVGAGLVDIGTNAVTNGNGTNWSAEEGWLDKTSDYLNEGAAKWKEETNASKASNTAGGKFIQGAIGFLVPYLGQVRAAKLAAKGPKAVNKFRKMLSMDKEAADKLIDLQKKTKGTATAEQMKLLLKKESDLENSIMDANLSGAKVTDKIRSDLSKTRETLGKTTELNKVQETARAKKIAEQLKKGGDISKEVLDTLRIDAKKGLYGKYMDEALKNLKDEDFKKLPPNILEKFIDTKTGKFLIYGIPTITTGALRSNNEGIEELNQDDLNKIKEITGDGLKQDGLNKEDTNKGLDTNKILEQGYKNRTLIKNPDGTISFKSAKDGKSRTFKNEEDAKQAINYGITNYKRSIGQGESSIESGDIIKKGDAKEINKIEDINELNKGTKQEGNQELNTMYENSNNDIKKEIDILKTNDKELNISAKKLNLNHEDYKSKEDLILDIIKKSIELKQIEESKNDITSMLPK